MPFTWTVTPGSAQLYRTIFFPLPLTFSADYSNLRIGFYALKSFLPGAKQSKLIQFYAVIDISAELVYRDVKKAKRRETKFIKGLADLRKKTRDNAWEKRQEKRHQCSYEVIEDLRTGKKTQKCVDCGFEVEIEEL